MGDLCFPPGYRVYLLIHRMALIYKAFLEKFREGVLQKNVRTNLLCLEMAKGMVTCFIPIRFPARTLSDPSGLCHSDASVSGETRSPTRTLMTTPFLPGIAAVSGVTGYRPS